MNENKLMNPINLMISYIVLIRLGYVKFSSDENKSSVDVVYEMLASSSLIFLGILVIVVGVIVKVGAEEEESRPYHVPPGMDVKMFPYPEQLDGDDVPSCISDKEPCGFYEISLLPDHPIRWQKSWCHCSSTDECVYDKTDEKRRLYELVCRPKERKKRTKVRSSRLF